VTDLGHALPGSQTASQPGAANTVDQVEPLGEIAMPRIAATKALSLGPLALGPVRAISSLQTFWIRGSRQVSSRFMYSLISSPICSDHRQVLGKRLQPGVGGGMDLLDRSSAGRNQRGHDLVVLARCKWNLHRHALVAG